MATNGISSYNIGGAAPLSRPAPAERPRETQPDQAPQQPRPSTVVEISPQARELARAAEAEQANKQQASQNEAG